MTTKDKIAVMQAHEDILNYNMGRYTLYCTKAQTKMALNLGAPITTIKSKRTKDTILSDDVIKYDEDTFTYVVSPTTEQMIGFLRDKGFRFHFDDITNFWRIVFNLEIIAKGYSETKELDAIDAALEYLSKNKKEEE